MTKPALTLLPLLVVSLLSGCATHRDYEGAGEYFELSHTNVVERDLTQAYVQPTMQTLAQTKPASVVRQQLRQSHQLGEIFQGERYDTALNRWLKQSGYRAIAWSIDDDTANALHQISPSDLTLRGTLASRVSQLGIHLDKTLVLTTRAPMHLAAVHQYHAPAFVTLAHGATLKAAIQHLVTDYHHPWGDDDARSPSYRASDDYAFAASYPIVTEKGNLTLALNTLLEGYPVQAQILQSTGQVFIEDNK
jgi:hypothetical protein|uniref:Toxin co-regulated pilus biosynthesis protein Q C-terminal domain-containing protein n=1 Tax=Vibrio sp. 23023 TaxID=452803 RepID=A9M4S7_9VIBR|nr:hypothetical protein [Vibrio sp. 23023]ABX77036.1 Hypothetical protein BMSA_0059 [Vibrio sp. 23023]